MICVMKRLLATVVATASLTYRVMAGEGVPPIIDVHVHAFTADERWGANVANPITGAPLAARNAEDHRRATFAEFRKHGITRAVVSGDWTEVLKWKAAAPDTVITSYYFGETLPDPAFLRAEHRAGRLQAIGEIAVQYEGLPPNDQRLEPYYALAEELNLPLAIHIGPGPRGAAYRGYVKYRMALTDPLALEDVLVRHPKLRLSIMHAAWPRLEDLLALLYAHPQVYVDVGLIAWNQPRAEFNHYLRRLVDAGYGKRIMFGSDQMVWVDAIGMALESINAAEFLTAQQKRDILYNNAQRFFQIAE